VTPATTRPGPGADSGYRVSRWRSRDACPEQANRRGSRQTAEGTTIFNTIPPTASESTDVPSSPADSASETASLRRRLVTAVVLATATVTLVLAVPPLRGVAQQIGAMNPVWVVMAVALELGSCATYVVIFRLFFDEVPPRVARELGWTEEASGALLPTGGVGALAIGGWLLRRAGMSTRKIVERSSALFFLTSAVNVAALVGAGVLFATGALGGSSGLLLGGIPALLGFGSIWVTLAVPARVRRMQDRRRRTWLIDVADGIDGARRALLAPSWRLLGALGYLGFDIAALGAAFAATGHPVGIDTLVLGYIIGYLANLLPVPGGFGVLEAGLAGVLIAYGAPATQAVAAVIVYHAIAFWVPSLGGLIGYARLRRGPVTADAWRPPARSGLPARRATDGSAAA